MKDKPYSKVRVVQKDEKTYLVCQSWVYETTFSVTFYQLKSENDTSVQYEWKLHETV